MSELLLEFSGVAGTGFKGISFALGCGETLVVEAKTPALGVEWTDTATGLRTPREGTVKLFGRDLAGINERARLRMSGELGFAGAQGHLVGNLKLWENILLPSVYRGPLDLEAAEQVILEGFGVAGMSSAWVEAHMPKTPDHLTAFQARVAGMVRAAVLRPRLFISEFVFDDIDEPLAERLGQVAEWLKRLLPGLGVMHVRHGGTGGRFGLISEGAGGTIELGEVAE